MIVITTPTGQIGHQLLDNVLDSGESIRVIVRDPSRLPAHALERVEVVKGSHGDVDVVNDAFAGADTVFWVVPPDPKAESVDAAYVDFSQPASVALKSQGVKRVVVVTGLGRGTALARNAGHVTASLKMDDLIASSGVSHRSLTMPSYMENLINRVESIRNNGMFVSPISGDRKLPTCATRDIAAVAAKLLLDDSWSGQDHVAVLGPEDVSFNDMAQIMSEVLEKPVRFEQIPGEVYKSRFIELGMSQAMAQGSLDIWRSRRTMASTTPSRERPRTRLRPVFGIGCEEVLKPAVLN